MIKSSRDGIEKVVITAPPLESLEAPRDGVKETSNIVTNPDRTTVVDLERIPAQHLLQYANGSPWAVMWFRRLWGKNDPRGQFDPSVINATQQTERIYNLVLKVNSAMSPSQDQQRKTFTREGSATVVTSIPPNEFDFFIADLGDNRFGLFTVMTSVRKSDNKVAVYEISFTMLYEITPQIADAVNKSVVRTYHYVSDRAWVGIDPLLTPDEFNRFNSIETYRDIIESSYVNRFFDHRTRSLGYPGTMDGEHYYDVYLTMFVRLLGLRHVPDDLRVYNHMPLHVEDVFTLWKLLEQRSPWMLSKVEQKGGWYISSGFRSRHGMNTVAYSQVTASFAFQDTISVNSFTNGALTLADWPANVEFHEQQIAYRGVEGETLPAFLPLSRNELYVLSSAFYEGSYASGLEYGLYCFINQQPVPSQLACGLAEQLMKLPDAEQLYYTPLVYMLLNYTR